jgi:hypothetical protein
MRGIKGLKTVFQQCHVSVITSGGDRMKRNMQNLSLALGQIDQRHVRLGLGVLTLILFVLGAGAPGTSGDGGG